MASGSKVYDVTLWGLDYDIRVWGVGLKFTVYVCGVWKLTIYDCGEHLEFEVEIVAQNRNVEDLPPHRRLLLHLLGPAERTHLNGENIRIWGSTWIEMRISQIGAIYEVRGGGSPGGS